MAVTLPLAPAHYEASVRSPGMAFLDATPNPNRSDWEQHRYWKEIHQYLYDSLKGICSYCASFTPRKRSPSLLDHSSIDHFIPKSINNALAYEWENFRLCRTRLNNRKSAFQDVLDPCAIQTGMFKLNFATFALFPNPTLSEADKQKVLDTIARLELNTDDAYVNERARAVYSYADRKLSLAVIAQLYPFIASEIIAENFDTVYLPTFRTVLEMPNIRSALIAQGWMT